MKRFQHQHVVITGGARGIGAACVKMFLEEGARVSVFDRDAVSSSDLVTSWQLDVTDEVAVSEAVAEAVRHRGDIAVLVNNAGIQRYGTVTETTSTQWDEVMNANLKSAFLCAHYVLPSMLRAGHGVIVNVASVQAFLSQQRVAAYTTSKTALLGLTRSIAIDYAPSIRCVAVCPGTVDTPMLRNAIEESPDPLEVYNECVDMHPLKRIAQPDEVAALIGFLASDKAAFITGQAFRVDGGLGISIAGSKRQ